MNNENNEKIFSLSNTHIDTKNKEEDFNDFFNDVINMLPIKSSKIIKSSFSKTQTNAEKLLKENSQKFDSIFEPFLTDVTPQIRKKCHKAIHFASLTSAIVGFSPIPFSDAVFLVSIQLSMLTRLYSIFGEKWQEGLTKSLAKELVVVGLGKSAVGNLLKLIPTTGTVTGGIVNATVASTITETLGWLTVKALNDGEDIFDEAASFKEQFNTLYSTLSETTKKKVNSKK